MTLKQRFQQSWRGYAVAVFAIGLAATLRLWPLQALESNLAWLTFYPAVMVVAIYGGAVAGLLATGLACLTVTFLWSLLVAQPFVKEPADWLGMIVFVLTGAMISGVAEAMRRANHRAQVAQAQAEAANRAKSAFLATISHELRTPMNAILGFSELLRNDPGISRGQRDTLDIINRSGQHLLSLINDVLDMAKIEAGQVVLENKPLDIEATLRDVTDLMRVPAQKKGLGLRFESAPGCPRFIRGDQEKLRQVTVNLVNNAIKFTQHGQVTLRLDVRPRAAAWLLLIEVADSGRGIEQADLARVFEPFVQVGGPATHTGTGLGLAIVREYVRRMGGSVSVESQPGQGSVFRVELPVQLAEQVDASATDETAGRVIGLAPGQAEFRVLIVEDQLENQLLLSRLLEDVGFTVKVAADGAEGVELFRSFRPAFIWMDRRMPVMDGLEATRRIRALEGGQDVRIVALSASVLGEQREETLAQGLDDFVAKPYRSAEIFACMARHLGVRYRYAPAESVSPIGQHSLSGLAQLPKPLREELSDALIQGNTQRIAEVMLCIGERDKALVKSLERNVSQFDYLPILQVLESVGQQDAETGSP